MLLFAILLLVSAPFTSFASDMWSETPDFNHDSKVDSMVSGAATFSNNNPGIDMWDETPDLSKEKKDQGNVIDVRSRLVDHFDQEMYAETPDLRLS